MRWCASLVAAAALLLLGPRTIHAQEQEAPAPEAPPAESTEPSEEAPPTGEEDAQPDDGEDETPAETPGAEGDDQPPAEPPSDETTGEAEVEPRPDDGGDGSETPAETPPVEPPAGAPGEAAQAQPAPAPADTVVEPDLGEDEEEGEDEATGGDDGDGEDRQRLGAEETWADALPFRGSSITYGNIFNAYQLNRGSDITYNPYYAMSLAFAPRWYFTDPLSLRLGFSLETELTNADGTTDYHETLLSDLTLDLVYDPIVTIPVVGVSVGAGLRVQLPTSLQAQAETMYMAFGPQIRLARVFDVLDGLVVFYSFRYSKHLNRYTTLQRQTNPYSCTADDLSCLAHNQLGSPARSHGFFNSLMVNLSFLRQWRPMHAGIMVSFVNYLSYGVPEATVPLMGGAEAEVDHIEEPVRHRAAIVYVFEVGIEITDYIGLSLGASTMSPQLRPDSTYRQPFFNRYTNLFVDLSLDVERLVAVFRR